MKDEIKEILDLKIDCDYKRLSVDEIVILKDYITNLHQYYKDNVNRYEKLIEKYTNLQEDLKHQKEAEQEYNEKHTKLMNKYKNLQEENERFKARWKDTNVIIKDDKTLVMNTNAYNYLEDYKSRIEKAIEYIMTELITEWDIENGGCVSGSDLPIDAITPLLNILQGVGKDE